jgi:hypothetical protein
MGAEKTEPKGAGGTAKGFMRWVIIGMALIGFLMWLDAAYLKLGR